MPRRATSARRSPARRPGPDAGPVIGFQRWDEILFIHWEVPADALRPLVDRRLELDLLDRRAYVSLTPFTMRGARVRGLPHLPFLTEFHELNARTYVRAEGVPGLWFFSLDAASAPAAAIARATLGLPYFRARMTRTAAGGTHEFESERLPPMGRRAAFSASWTAGTVVPSQEGSLDHFLAERYALYTTLAGKLLRVRVRHPRWVLRAASLERLDESVTRAADVGITRPPALVRCSAGVDVEVFPPERVGRSGLERRRARRATSRGHGEGGWRRGGWRSADPR